MPGLQGGQQYLSFETAAKFHTSCFSAEVGGYGFRSSRSFRKRGKLKYVIHMRMWRNWQTRRI
jgi:hypothetical protein